VLILLNWFEFNFAASKNLRGPRKFETFVLPIVENGVASVAPLLAKSNGDE
jgi:hypothetical protein